MQVRRCHKRGRESVLKNAKDVHMNCVLLPNFDL